MRSLWDEVTRVRAIFCIVTPVFYVVKLTTTKETGRKPMRCVACLLVACSAFVASWCGAEEFEALRGLRTVGVSVVLASPSGKSQDVVDCGLTEPSVRTAVESVLQQSRLKLVSGTWQANLAINVVVIPSRIGQTLAGCSYAASVRVDAPLSGSTSWGGKVGSAVIWLSDYTGASPAPILKSVADSVAEQTKKFVVDWANVN
jgi:hypothetical protein